MIFFPFSGEAADPLARVRQVSPPRDPEMIGYLSPVMMEPEGDRAGWRELVTSISGSFPRYVCLIVFDSSAKSELLRGLISKRYRDIDRLSGKEILILSTVPPPDDWFAEQLDRISKLDPAVQEYERECIAKIRSVAGENLARANEARFLSEMFSVTDLKLPAICFLWSEAQAGGAEATIRADYFDFSDFQSEERLIGVVRFLAEAARDGLTTGRTPTELAAEAYSWTNPRSLTWRGALSRVAGLAELVTSWIKKLLGK